MSKRLPTLFFASLLLVPFLSDAVLDTRRIEDNVLITEEDPRLALRIGLPFKYVGVHEFDIRGIAGGSRHIWVDAKESQVQRLFVVQLEGFYPGSDGQYQYDLSGSPELAGYRWRSNGYAFNLSNTRLENPGNESSVTAEYLEQQGYELPDLILMWRSLTVVNEARTHEAILFLMESGDQHGLEVGDLYQDDEDTPLWRELQTRLELDFNRVVELSPLDDEGNVTGEWKRIPVHDK
jgi:hypothetical protein